MEDRFRFRFFNKTIEFMGTVESLSIQDDWAMVRFSYADEETPNDEVELSGGVLMQCTGLKDKNKKLIYEGDWVELNCGDGDVIIGEVFWIKDDARFSIRHPKGYHGYFGFRKKIIEICNKFEVIGNIYKNPELLKKNDNL